MLLHDHRYLLQGTKLCKFYIFKLLNTFGMPWFTSFAKPLQNASLKCLWRCKSEFFRFLGYYECLCNLPLEYFSIAFSDSAFY